MSENRQSEDVGPCAGEESTSSDARAAGLPGAVPRGRGGPSAPTGGERR